MSNIYRGFLSFSLPPCQFLNAWVHKIRGLGVGDLAMAPCGWIRPDGTGHILVFVVMRLAAEGFSLSVINPCGEGAEYHAQEPDPAKGKVSKESSQHLFKFLKQFLPIPTNLVPKNTPTVFVAAPAPPVVLTRFATFEPVCCCKLCSCTLTYLLSWFAAFELVWYCELCSCMFYFYRVGFTPHREAMSLG